MVQRLWRLRQVQARARGAITRSHVGEMKQKQLQERQQLAAIIVIQAGARGLIVRTAPNNVYKALLVRKRWQRARQIAVPSRRPPPLPNSASSQQYSVSPQMPSRGVSSANSLRRGSVAPSREAPVSPRGASSTDSLRRGSVAPSREAPVATRGASSTDSLRRGSVAPSREAPVIASTERAFSLRRDSSISPSLPRGGPHQVILAERYFRRVAPTLGTTLTPQDHQRIAGALFTTIAGSAEVTVISVDELCTFFASTYGTKSGLTMSLVSTLDANGDGLISREEWAEGFTIGMMEAMGVVMDEDHATRDLSSFRPTVDTSQARSARGRRMTTEVVQRPPRRCTVRGVGGANAHAPRIQEEVDLLSPREGN